MRQNSPTGGALGAVSDTENKLLQSTIDSLDQGLSPDILKANLESVRAQRQRSLDNLKRTYDRDADILGRSPMAAASASPAAPVSAPSSPAVNRSIPTVNTRAEYDALPAGAEYIDSKGTLARKGGGG